MACLVLTGAFAPARAETDGADDVRRLEAGDVLIYTHETPGYSLPRVSMTGLIKAPPEKVWAIVENCARYKDTMPRTVASEMLFRKGNEMRCRVVLDMPFPLGDLTAESDVVLSVGPGGIYKRTWKLRAGDFRVNEGSWTLEPYAGGTSTKLTYQVLSEPNVPLPQFILDMALQRSLPQIVENLRKQTE